MGTNDNMGTVAVFQKLISERTIKEDSGSLDEVQHSSNGI